MTDARVKRQGQYLEKLGHYDPMGKDESKISIDVERVKHWIGLGAQATEKAASLLKQKSVNPNEFKPRKSKKPKEVAATA